MKSFVLFLLAGLLCCLSSCATDKPYQGFVERSDYRNTLQVYRNDKLLEQAKLNLKKQKVVVDLKRQRVKLIQDGWVALDIPCCTGKKGKETPIGEFTITEKVRDKRSNLFGQLFDEEGELLHAGDRRKYKEEFHRYEGYSIPFWMRLNNDGIGMHESKSIYRSPSSNGCIRLPKKAAEELYHLVETGTAVCVDDDPRLYYKRWFAFRAVK